MENTEKNALPEERLQDNAFGRVARLLDRCITVFAQNLAIICFLVMLVVILMNVVMRYVLKIPNMWGEELARYLMVCGVYLGVACGCRARAHVAMDLVVQKVPKSVQKIMKPIIQLIVVAVYAMLLYYTVVMTIKTRATGQISPAMNLKMWICYLGIDIGLLLATIVEVLLFVNDFCVKKKFITE